MVWPPARRRAGAAQVGQAMTALPEASKPALTPPSEASCDAYLRFRQYIEHENQLVNFRTTWAIGSNSFLLLAFGTTLTSANGPHVAFLVALSIAGMLVNAASWRSVEAAYSVLDGLKKRWDDLDINHPFLPPVTGLGKERIINLGHFGSRFLLVALAVIWLGLFIYSLSL
jgi:hypothetical protein